jgi:carbon-monoxide dehydrogenase small subunit
VISIELTVNGEQRSAVVRGRDLLVDMLRDALGLTGTKIGCSHGVCGSCTIQFDGRPVRSCLLLAAQADGATITTVEGLAPAPGTLHPVQAAFWEEHGLQCGFCTPGFLITVTDLLGRNPDPDETEIREALSGNICRCTGFQSIVAAVQQASRRLRSGETQVPLPSASRSSAVEADSGA